MEPHGQLLLITLKQQQPHLENAFKLMNKLITKYTQLLERAEQTTSRREALRLINESTKLREQIAQLST